MEKLGPGLPIEIASVNRTNLPAALGAIRGCLKTASMLWMRTLGVPSLMGVAVSDWSKESVRAVERFAADHKFSELLLRIDKRDQRWTRRRGGYLIPLSEAGSTVALLRKEGFISVFLEPASPFSDDYSMAAVTIPDQQKLVIEIVGQGFDTSDILRGDIPAHESWEFKITHDAVDSGRRVKVVTPDQYKLSVQERLAKIGARLKNPAFPDEIRANTEKGELSSTAMEFLRHSDQTALLETEDYDPIPTEHLKALTQGIERILSGLSEYGIHLGSCSFAASVIPKRRLVFWDFFPAAKQESALLFQTA